MYRCSFDRRWGSFAVVLFFATSAVLFAQAGVQAGVQADVQAEGRTEGNVQRKHIRTSEELPQASAQKSSEKPPEAPPIFKRNSKRKRSFYWHINLQYINDFQNGNLILNLDDRLTYGITTIFALNNWEFFWHYSSLTDRYVSHARIDEQQFGFRYTYGNLLSAQFWNGSPSQSNRRPEATYSPSEPLYLGLKLEGSYFQAGNILGERIQNFMHSHTKVPKVYGRYPERMVHTLSLAIEPYFAFTVKIPGANDARLESGLALRMETALGYQESVRIGLRGKLYSGNQYLQWDFYLQQLGYFEGYGLEGSMERVWSDTRSAAWLAFSSRVGLYRRRVDMSFGSLSRPEALEEQVGYPFGFGSLELSWAHLQKKKDFVDPDFSHSLLYSFDGLWMDRFAFPFRLGKQVPSDISFLAVRDRVGPRHLFKGNSLARKTESLWLGMFHLRPTLDLNKLGFLEFYSGLGAGLLTMVFLNSIEKISQRVWRQYFALAGQVGLRWYGLALRRDGAVYGIEVALLSFIPFHGNERYIRFTKTGLYINNLEPRLTFMFGLTILTDW
ncbi:MAG: hypothetical protein AAF975_03860 [Spirochaetota bacterium]